MGLTKYRYNRHIDVAEESMNEVKHKKCKSLF